MEYEAEGIEWSSVSFVDNQECLDLVAKKPTGLLQLLDEECRYKKNTRKFGKVIYSTTSPKPWESHPGAYSGMPTYMYILM